jgi:hypothetical protein
MKRVIRSDKPVTLLLFWSHKCDIGAEPRSRIIATSAVKGLRKTFFSDALASSAKWLLVSKAGSAWNEGCHLVSYAQPIPKPM